MGSWGTGAGGSWGTGAGSAVGRSSTVGKSIIKGATELMR